MCAQQRIRSVCAFPQSDQNFTEVLRNTKRTEKQKNKMTHGKTYNIKPHCYTIKLGSTGIYINFLVSGQNIGTR